MQFFSGVGRLRYPHTAILPLPKHPQAGDITILHHVLSVVASPSDFGPPCGRIFPKPSKYAVSWSTYSTCKVWPTEPPVFLIREVWSKMIPCLYWKIRKLINMITGPYFDVQENNFYIWKSRRWKVLESGYKQRKLSVDNIIIMYSQYWSRTYTSCSQGKFVRPKAVRTASRDIHQFHAAGFVTWITLHAWRKCRHHLLSLILIRR